jgi:hypothetical protein
MEITDVISKQASKGLMVNENVLVEMALWEYSEQACTHAVKLCWFLWAVVREDKYLLNAKD